MENASKALIMAGSVLIALMIIGALLLMFNNLTSYQNAGIQNTREDQVIEFNNQYETYNRNNVRGSELYSLLNRVIDYNRRKSKEGTGEKDEGQYLAYQPMTISFDFNGKRKDFSATEDNIGLLIKSDKYTQSSTTNTFEDDIKRTVEDLENKYGTDSLTNLTTGLTKIFISDKESDNRKQEAINNFNNACKSKSVKNWNGISENSTIRKDIYKYYEYIQFKRAKFDCYDVKYSEKTGRIIEMNFKFNGKFE